MRYHDWRIMERFLTINGWCFKFDLKHGYHHIDLHPEVQDYFGFSWKISGSDRYFVFTVLVFGLSPAPRIFTKIMRPLSTYWRAQGIRIAVYLDDGAGTAVDKSTAEEHAIIVRDTLGQAGFIINITKSIWEPTTHISWLGLTVNTIAKKNIC